MTITAGSVKSRMQRSRGKPPGWTAFDRMQRQKESAQPEPVGDPFPPVSNVISPGTNVATDQCPHVRSFSSIVRPSMHYQSLGSTSKSGVSDNSGKKHKDQIGLEINATSTLERLKKVHGWATEDLIQDILAAADNDEKQALAILKGMTLSDSKEEQTNLLGRSGVLQSYMYEEKTAVSDESSLLVNEISDITHGEQVARNSSLAPAEPEWEEDDVYLIHRKDAIRMMRAVSQHARAASNAFLRGDHFSAQQLSLKAQEERITAEKLNARAAKKILSIRNSNNDMWKLDLHGLHATEAVNALKEHLHRIESEIVIKHSDSSDKTTKPGALPRQKQIILHVITGTGNHSHGQAALPTAVRSFLIENGYGFDDARPGVLAVRPKFCCS